MNRKRTLLFTLAICGTLAIARPSRAAPQTSQPDGQAAGKQTDEASDFEALVHFAPLWMPIPRFAQDPNSSVPSFAYATIWQPQWQREIGLSDEQKKALVAINDKAVADGQRRAEEFKSLSPAEKQARIKASPRTIDRSPRPSDIEIAKQIEAVLTPRQLQTLKDYSFPGEAVVLLYLASVRRDIAFSPEQENMLRRTIGEKMARFQQKNLERAEKVWALLSPQQQAELPEVVKRQGPTSAVLSMAWELGFNYDNFIPHYPLLGELPVRELLVLNAEQEKQLQAIMAETAATVKKAREGGGEPVEADDKERVEAILTPQQLTTLQKRTLHRQVVLALGYPEKRDSIGMSDQQKAELQRLDKETTEQLYRIDREMLGKALAILTATQREQLSKEIDRRIGG